MFKFLLPLLLMAGAAQAQCLGPSTYDTLSAQERAEIETAAAATPFGEGLFWEATRGDDRLIFIGTIHIYDPRLEAFMPFVTESMAGAELLLVEMDEDDRSEFEGQIAADPTLILLPEGQALPDLLPPAVWDELRAATEARGLPGFMISRFQPWYLSLLLTIPPCAMPQILEGANGFDFMIMEAAAERGVPSQSLEPWTTLFTIFSEDPLEDQIAMLSISLMEPAAQSAVFVAMLDDYMAERTAAIWEMSKNIALARDGIPGRTMEEMFAEFEDALLIQRNLNWIPVIEAAAADHDTIVLAFGAAHLGGESGVLNLLEANGWAISRVAP